MLFRCTPAALLLGFMLSCNTISYQYYRSTPSDEIKDIPAYTPAACRMTFPTHKNLSEHDYHFRFMQGFQYMRSKNYDAAIPLFTFCARTYNDEGNALAMRSTCYQALGQLPQALDDFLCARKGGYEADDADQQLAAILHRLGSAELEEGRYAEAISYFKTANSLYGKNRLIDVIVHGYRKLSEQRTGSARVVTLFHMYNYLKKTGARPSENMLNAAGALANALTELPQAKFLSAAVPIIKHSLNSPGKPDLKAYLHYRLGEFHMLLGNNESARNEFSRVMREYPRSGQYTNSRQRYLSIGRIRYSYLTIQKLTIHSNEPDISSMLFRFKIVMPQSVDQQTAAPPSLFINGRSARYSVVADQSGNQFLDVDGRGYISKGTNIIEVRTTLEKTSTRVPVSRIQSVSLEQYNRTDTRYKILTMSGDIVKLDHPVVASMYAELKEKIKSSNVAEIAAAVYDAVIDKLTYKLYDQLARPKQEMFDRLRRDNYTGVCEDYAALTTALLRRFGIPASCYTGPMLEEKIGHAWPVFYLPDYTAVTLDATWGETPPYREYYKFFASNLTVAEQRIYHSGIIPQGNSFTLSSDKRLEVKILDKTTRVSLRQ